MNLKEILNIKKKDIDNLKKLAITNIDNNLIKTTYDLFICIKITIVDWLELIDYVNCNIVDNEYVNELVKLIVNLNINIKEKLIHNLIMDYNINNLNVIKILEKNYMTLFSSFESNTQKISVVKINSKNLVEQSEHNNNTISLEDNKQLLKSLETTH